MMTGKPTNCTGNSKSGASSCARTTALSLKSIILNISADNSVSDGNITCSCIFKCFFVCRFSFLKNKLVDFDSHRNITNLSSNIHCNNEKSNIHNYFSIIKISNTRNNFQMKYRNINWNQICWIWYIWLTACVTNW